MPDFTNMLAWWQWMILAAVPPLIVALYFLKLKRRPLEVPSTYLWHKSIEDLHVNAIWQRLRRNILLLLQLLLLAAVALALIRPSWHGLQLTGHRFIFLVDNSASMQATDVKPSRLDDAKRRVGELIEQMRSGDVAMIISFCDTSRVVQTFTDDRRRLRETLAAIRPTWHATSLLEALKVASGLANPGRSSQDMNDVRVASALPAKLFIFSDGKFPPVTGFELGNLEPVFVSIGQAEAANVGIVAFSVGRNEAKPGQLQAIARLTNFGPAAASVPVQLYRDGQLRDEDRLDLPPGRSGGVPFDLGVLDSGVLRLKIKTGDALATDDEAWAVLSAPRRTKILLISPGNEPLETALATKSAREVAEVDIQRPGYLKDPKYTAQASLGTCDLVIYDRCQPDKMPRANTLFIGSLPTEGGWKAGKKVPAPQIIDAVGSHPLLQWIDLGDVLLAEGTPLAGPSTASVLVDSDSGPMMALAPREGFEDLVLGFVLVDEAVSADGHAERYIGTNWPIRASFASFVLNVVNYLGGSRDAGELGSVRPGSAVTIDAPSGGKVPQVRMPSGRMVAVQTLPSGKFSFTETDEPGVYEVVTAGKPGQRFAVNLLDERESDIQPGPAPTIKIGHVEVKNQSGWESHRRESWRVLVAAGLVVLLVEWYIYNRRIY
jgi:hypothetical protein